MEQVSQEAELRAELERARASGKMFRSATIALSIIFVMILAVAFMGYRKVMQAKAMMEGVSQELQPLGVKVYSGSGDSAVAEPLRAGADAGPAAPDVSSLGMFSVPDSGEAQSPAAGEDKERMFKALGKYSDRPLVKEFFAELKKDPDYNKASEAKKGGNPMAMIAGMQKSAGMRALISKYMRRPEFMTLMAEVTQDPEMRPFLRGMPGGAGAMLGAMPPSASAAGRAQLGGESEDDAEQDGGGEISFDASAISGSAKPSSRSAVKPPPPVDKGR
jgi:hypothetical protein